MTKGKKGEAVVGKASIWTQSRIGTTMTCERMAWYGYIAGGTGIRPAVEPDYFIEGEFLHYALRHWYGNPPNGLMLRENLIKRINAALDKLTIQAEELAGIKQKLAAMMGACFAYRQRYKGDFKAWKILHVEKKFAVEIGGVPVEGRIDLVVQDADGKVGFVEHKAYAQYSGNQWATLPLNLQQLVYSQAVKTLTGALPAWYMWNIVKKSSLRQKTGENLTEFEARVTQQYLEDPDKMFIRPPVRAVEPRAIETLGAIVAEHIRRWQECVDKGEIPPMRLTSCEGRYNNACAFGPACVAAMSGKTKEGWDAPECRGMYAAKDTPNPELEDEED